MTDLTKLTSAELTRLANSIRKEMAKRSDATKNKVLKAVAKLAKEAGIEISEILNTKSAVKPAKKTASARVEGDVAVKKPKKRAKYENPANAKQRWSGHGRRPAWVVEHQAAGGSLDDLRIGRSASQQA